MSVAAALSCATLVWPDLCFRDLSLAPGDIEGGLRYVLQVTACNWLGKCTTVSQPVDTAEQAAASKPNVEIEGGGLLTLELSDSLLLEARVQTFDVGCGQDSGSSLSSRWMQVVSGSPSSSLARAATADDLAWLDALAPGVTLSSHEVIGQAQGLFELSFFLEAGSMSAGQYYLFLVSAAAAALVHPHAGRFHTGL